MSSRRWLALGVVFSLVAVAGLRLALPELIRLGIVARVRAITGRPVSLAAVDVAVLGGRVALRGFRLGDRPGEEEPFAEFRRLDLHLRPSALLRGHLWLRAATLHDSTVRVIRYPSDEFNLSDLIRQADRTQRVLDVTVDRFAVVNGAVTLEDRALPEGRTWRSEQIRIEAQDLSTRPQYGSAVGTSVTGGAPVAVRVDRLRLYPIDLQATVTVEGLDLAMGRVYLPAEAPAVVDQGRASTSVQVWLDAREGLRLDATARVEDVVVNRRGGEPLARVPALTATLRALHFHPGGMALGQLTVDGSAAILDPSAASPGRFAATALRARVADLTWPVSTPAVLDISTRVQGRGNLVVAGTLRPPTVPSDLRLRLDGFDLAPWARFVPGPAQMTGVAEGDLRINEPIGARVPSRVRGTIAVRNVGVSDGRERLLTAQRIEGSGLELYWPERLRVGQLAIQAPRVRVERDRAGDFPLTRLWKPPANVEPAGSLPAPAASGGGAPPPGLGVEMQQVLVQDGTAEWRDHAVTPPVRATLSDVTATVSGAGWPVAGPLDVRLAARPTGGGQVRLAGRVGLTPLTADARVTAKAVDLAPYQPYLGTPARLSAWADLDVAVVLPADTAGPTVRGSAALTGVDVRDGERTVMRIERAAVSGLDIEWPRRVAVAHLALQAPWILVERDEHGAMPMRTLLPAGGNGAMGANGAVSPGPAASGVEAPSPTAVMVGRVTMDDGGARLVDRSISPPFALDLRRLTMRAEGVSRAPGPSARLDLTAQAGSGAVVKLRGTSGAIGGPLQLDLSGELGGFDVPRANSYLARYTAWQAHAGSLTTQFECRIQGQDLAARADVLVSRLEVVRAASADARPDGIGLPLNLVFALMRDSRGNIRVSVPVGGRLSDPRFDLRDAIRSAVRTVAVNTIMLPVSWIGRLHVSPDSEIQRVEVDPVRFEPATATLTPDGQVQLARMAAFLGQVGEVRMALTPVVSGPDLAELRARAAAAAVDRLAAQARISREEAATRLFRERLPDRAVPVDPQATLAALAGTEASPAHASDLATRRRETLLATLKEAGIPPGRLVDTEVTERPDSTQGVIELNLLEPDTSRRSQLLQFLHRLGGAAPGGSQ